MMAITWWEEVLRAKTLHIQRIVKQHTVATIRMHIIEQAMMIDAINVKINTLMTGTLEEVKAIEETRGTFVKKRNYV